MRIDRVTENVSSHLGAIPFYFPDVVGMCCLHNHADSFNYDIAHIGGTVKGQTNPMCWECASRLSTPSEPPIKSSDAPFYNHTVPPA